MGMSASQARLLTITARQNDVELKSQQISNVKMRVAQESEQVSTNYLNALSKTKLQYTSYETGTGVNHDLNSASLANLGLKLYDKDGNEVTSNISAGDMSSMIASGEYYLGTTSGTQVSISELTTVMEVSDDSDMAIAEAEYNEKTLKINNKEKKLDLELKTLDTEHNALKTEYETVKTLISENIEKSFQMFS